MLYPYIGDYWLGLQKSEGHWRWSDGVIANLGDNIFESLRNVNNTQEHTFYNSRNGHFYTSEKIKRYPFVCEYKSKSTSIDIILIVIPIQL